VCGVIAAAGQLDLSPAVAALAHRGPDAAATAQTAGVSLGHTRLAIQDPDARSDQPYTDGPVTLAYNGELFNAAGLKACMPARQWVTTGDTEVLAAALHELGPAQTLRVADGMFGIAWADARTTGILNLARDRHGEVPLHVHRGTPVLAASELKAFTALGRRCGPAVTDVPPGQWWQITLDGTVTRHVYHQQQAIPAAAATLDSAAVRLGQVLAQAVDRRVIADVPVCSLLSGGIDSAAIALELTRHHPDLVCYTARLSPRSPDLRCARETADMIGAKLVEVNIPVPTADDLTSVIRHIEMPFKAQIEIAWACLHLAKAISADGFKVTYSGEGSDELWASYGFAYHGLAKTDWHTYRRSLIAAQAVRNFPRVNKAFLTHAVEARLPFLDPNVVDLALALPRHAVQDGPSRPKAVLQRAYLGRLPDTVTRRPKLAFQDGLGLKQAITSVLPDPGRYYRAEYRNLYQ
jgi:asparagine synthase (glutamine-hydrolysing)